MFYQVSTCSVNLSHDFFIGHFLVSLKVELKKVLFLAPLVLRKQDPEDKVQRIISMIRTYSLKVKPVYF